MDGVKHAYEHVWLAPTMHGRYYGGGMIPTPQQNRLAHTDVVEVLTGREITVEFDRPAPLQIDGETVPDVTAYRAAAFAEAPVGAANA